MQGKVASRSISPIKGNLILTITVGEGKDAKTVNSSLTKEQIQMVQLIGGSVPNVGQTVNCEYTVNPGTGQQSDQWVTVSI